MSYRRRDGASLVPPKSGELADEPGAAAAWRPSWEEAVRIDKWPGPKRLATLERIAHKPRRGGRVGGELSGRDGQARPDVAAS